MSEHPSLATDMESDTYKYVAGVVASYYERVTEGPNVAAQRSFAFKMQAGAGTDQIFVAFFDDPTKFNASELANGNVEVALPIRSFDSILAILQRHQGWYIRVNYDPTDSTLQMIYIENYP